MINKEKREVLKVIIFNVLISIFLGLINSFIMGIDFLYQKNELRIISSLILMVTSVLTYLFLIKKSLKNIEKKYVFKGSLFLLLLNMLLVVLGFLTMNFGDNIIAENGQIFIIINMFLNFGFIPFIGFIGLFKLYSFLESLIFSFIGPTLLSLSKIMQKE